MKLKKYLTTLLLLFPLCGFAKNVQLNIYVWADVIPRSLIQKFQKETGIKVNMTTFDSNEEMYAKIKAAGNPGYDVIHASTYFIQRMREEEMLLKLDKSQLDNFHYIEEDFLYQDYDPKAEYSAPYVWGAMGIFVNDRYHQMAEVQRWQQLWAPQYANTLLVVNEPREVFALTMLTLGYEVNSTDPRQIQQAFIKLRELHHNIRVFNSDAVYFIAADEDVTLGMMWNGDFYRAHLENPHLHFVYPEEGFVLSLDGLMIPQGAKNIENAHRFINFMLAPENAKEISLQQGFPVANNAVKQYLPEEIANNPVIYPPKATMKRAHMIQYLDMETVRLYQKYWELLKIS
jgi:spermidine/putrescine transport system substrate-binding protein